MVVSVKRGLFFEILLFCFFTGCFIEKDTPITRGQWVYGALEDRVRDNYVFSGKGELSLSADKNGIYSGELKGTIRHYFQCLSRDGCDLAESGTYDSIQAYLKGEVDFLEFNEKKEMTRYELAGQISGQDTNSEFIYLILKLRVKSLEQGNWEETVVMKGRKKGKVIQGIFRKSKLLNGSRWFLNI